MPFSQSLKFSNIIVRMPNWIGDLVMATPILADLREKFPSASITVMCKHSLCELLREDPSVDEVFCFTRPSGFLRRAENRSIIEKLKKGHYDLGVLLTHSFSSAWWFFRGGVKERLGYSGNLRKWLLTQSLKFPKMTDHQHLVLTYKHLLTPLGIPVSDTPPQLFLKDEEIEEARKRLLTHGIGPQTTLIGINPGAAYGSAKCWLPDRFRAVAKKLIQNPDYHVIFLGDTSHSSLVKEICHDLGPKVINAAGTTSLRQLMALISCCRLLLTNDSGPMHIADALKTPVVALFGSTSEILTGPYQAGTVIHKHVSCSPCFKRVCPIDFRCMKQIETDEVLTAIANVLKNSKLSLMSEK